MTKYKTSGEDGEKDVIDFVGCPNCKKALMQLPPSYPLYDVQCVACNFRAQVKTNTSRPKNIIRGAGWDIMDKVIKAGFLIPPLIANFKWHERGMEKQEIRFYPFVGKSNLIKYVANIKSTNRKYKMFNYNLKGLKYYVLYSR